MRLDGPTSPIKEEIKASVSVDLDFTEMMTLLHERLRLIRQTFLADATYISAWKLTRVITLQGQLVEASRAAARGA